MISILTPTSHKAVIEKAIQTVDRLEEVVKVVTEKEHPFDISFFTDTKIIRFDFDWYDNSPPYRISTVTFTESNLLASIFLFLNNHERAFFYLDENSKLYYPFLAYSSMQLGYVISKEQWELMTGGDSHNEAVLAALGHSEISFTAQEINQLFDQAISDAADETLGHFSRKHYINHLLDSQQWENAEGQILSGLETVQQKEAEISYKKQYAQWMSHQLTHPYAAETLQQISELQRECIAHFEAVGEHLQAGLLLMEATETHGLLKAFPSAKDCINKAILIFKEADIHHFLGESLIQKGILLYNWSKEGSPQYYKTAIASFQEALKIFKKEEHPQKYADVKHYLAQIFSEIQVAEKEKPLWSAFSAAAYQEAIEFYENSSHRYQFAMIAHNYATALMGFPEAKKHDNLSKANALFEKALQVRTSYNFPTERALTLLNQLELLWIIHNENQTEEEKNYELMIQKASEVSQLITDPTLLQRASHHMEALEAIKELN